MATTENVLAISAFFDRSPLGGWEGTTKVGGDGLAVTLNGLFALGDSMREARHNLARVVYSALPTEVRSDIGAVRIITVSRKTFSIADLIDLGDMGDLVADSTEQAQPEAPATDEPETAPEA